MLHRSFKPAKCKTALKMAASRIKLLKNKRDAQVKHLKRELAQLLESGQDQTARIRVEHVVREEKTMAAYDLIEIYCELIAARLPIIESQKNCPIDLKEAITSVIFASPRCADIPELMDVRKHLTAKYGKEFITAALELRPDCGVSRLLVEKLSAKAPDGPTKIKILRTIAEEHNVKWEPKSFEESELKPPEDLLNGPNTFEKSSANYVDPSNTQSSVSHDEKKPNIQLHIYDEKGPPRGQVPHQPMEKNSVPENFYNHSTRASSSSPNFDYSNVRDGKHGSSGVYPPGTGAEGINHAHTYSVDRNTSPVIKNWTMEFKDATAAAQAAAESAERASMAARAAAELSSRDNIARQYSTEPRMPSTYVPTDETQNHAGSTLRSQHVAGDSDELSRCDNISKQYSAESHISSAYVPRDEPQNYASSTMHNNVDGNSENLSYNRRNSRMNHGQIGSYGQDSHSDEDEDCARDDYKSTNFAQVKPAAASFSSRQSFGNLQTPDAYSPHHPSDTRGEHLVYSSMGRTSDKFQVPFTGELPDIRNSENVDYHEVNDQKQSSHDFSYSHTDAYSDDHDIFSNLSRHSRKSYDEDAFVAADKESIQRNTDETKSYDNASAVFDDYGSDNDENVFDLENRHTKQAYGYMGFPAAVERSPSPPFRDVNARTKQDIESPRTSMLESNILTEQKYASVFSRSSTRSAVDSQADELPVAFDDSDGHGSETEEELGRPKRMSVDDGSVNRKQDAVSHEVKADFLPAESAEIVEDVVSLKVPSLESGSELNFGTLTGGLRNKGYRIPPCSKVPVDRASFSRVAEEETSTKTEQVVEHSLRSDKNLSTSEDDSEDELRKHTSRSSREGYSRRAGIKENKKTSTRIPVPFFDRVNSDEEDFTQKPLERNTRPNTGFSRRTKPSPSYTLRSSNHKTNLSSEPYVDDDSLRSSYDAEAPQKTQIRENRAEIKPSSQEHIVSTHTASKPALESETFRSSERKPSWPKTRPQEQSSDHRSSSLLPKFSEQASSKTVSETKNAYFGRTSEPATSATKILSSIGDRSSKATSREDSSRDQPSHVHPKLPDYDTLAARLQSLRQNRQ